MPKKISIEPSMTGEMLEGQRLEADVAFGHIGECSQ